MRIILDECVDPRVKRLFQGHEVSTVQEMGWERLTDSQILNKAQHNFDALVTIDRGLEFQQNLAKFSLGAVIVSVSKNQVAYYRAIEKELLDAVERIHPGEVIRVGAT
jgi:predicted nuclease of predicted toxin-antitoxin system